MLKIENAIISVSDKTNLVEFGRELASQGINIYSTGGTLKALRDAGIEAQSISDYTGFPEIMDGRVKTLHPRIHGGILKRLDNEDDLAVMKEHGIVNFDLVCINLYPFEEVSKKLRAQKEGAYSEAAMNEAIENIDIGGPTMIRAAAKNYLHTTVIIDPAQYSLVTDELKANNGSISKEFRMARALDAFSRTGQYDSAISHFLNEAADIELPEVYNLGLVKKQPLRYGENPHQQAGFYVGHDVPWQQLQGKELSYNNLLDLDAAIRVAADFEEPVCAIFKHTNPCGVACGDNQLENLQQAIATDPVSHFGGIISFNRPVETATAEAMAKNFYEIIVAPDFEEGALAALKKKKNLRLIKCPINKNILSNTDVRNASFGYLVQNTDNASVDPADLKVVSEKKPSDEELAELLFAFRLVKFVKSNAIVFTSGQRSLAIGAGQMSRLDSMKIAERKAEEAGLSLKDSYMASDAFFPFRDTVDVAIGVGVKAIIQPGGSMRDQESIDAANEAGIIMVMTGMRHFRH